MFAKCEVSTWLAYAMAVYALASIWYLIATRTVGTPLKDSYTSDQLQIKEESTRKRRRIFQTGVVIAIAVLVLWRPFRDCSR